MSKTLNFIATATVFGFILAGIYGLVVLSNELFASDATFAEACAWIFGGVFFLWLLDTKREDAE